MHKRIDGEAIMEQINICVRAYGRQSMANELGKSYSTLSNELEERDYAKLGFRTVLSIITIAMRPASPPQSRQAAVMVLDLIEEGVGRVAYIIPDVSGRPMTKEMRLMSGLSKEFSECIHVMADSIEDGKWSRTEAEKCISETRDVLRKCLEIISFLESIHKTTLET